MPVFRRVLPYFRCESKKKNEFDTPCLSHEWRQQAGMLVDALDRDDRKPRYGHHWFISSHKRFGNSEGRSLRAVLFWIRCRVPLQCVELRAAPRPASRSLECPMVIASRQRFLQHDGPPLQGSRKRCRPRGPIGNRIRFTIRYARNHANRVLQAVEAGICVRMGRIDRCRKRAGLER